MTSLGLDLLIVPLDSEGRLKWVSGFSGSNGQAVITGDEGRGCGARLFEINVVIQLFSGLMEDILSRRWTSWTATGK